MHLPVLNNHTVWMLVCRDSITCFLLNRTRKLDIDYSVTILWGSHVGTQSPSNAIFKSSFPSAFSLFVTILLKSHVRLCSVLMHRFFVVFKYLLLFSILIYLGYFVTSSILNSSKTSTSSMLTLRPPVVRTLNDPTT